MLLLAGREFDARDDASSPNAAIVNDRFARRFFAGHDAVGRHVNFGRHHVRDRRRRRGRALQDDARRPHQHDICCAGAAAQRPAGGLQLPPARERGRRAPRARHRSRRPRRPPGPARVAHARVRGQSSTMPSRRSGRSPSSADCSARSRWSSPGSASSVSSHSRWRGGPNETGRPFIALGAGRRVADRAGTPRRGRHGGLRRRARFGRNRRHGG